jgi:hypothetical protein
MSENLLKKLEKNGKNKNKLAVKIQQCLEEGDDYSG